MEAGDSAIKARIEEVFRNTSRVDEKEIRVEVRDGGVVLAGEVDAAIEKKYARELAGDVQGVREVSDRLRIRNFAPRPDAELAEEVRHALLRDAFVEPERIEVYASMGQVRLDGSVPTYAARKAAADVAWWTPGVLDVENLLLVTDEEFVDVSPGEVVDA